MKFLAPFDEFNPKAKEEKPTANGQWIQVYNLILVKKTEELHRRSTLLLQAQIRYQYSKIVSKTTANHPIVQMQRFLHMQFCN